MDAVRGRQRALTLLCLVLCLGAAVRALPHSLPAPVAASLCPTPVSRGDDRWDFQTLGCEAGGGESVHGSQRLLLGLRLDVNTATQDDLAALPGVGPHTAARLVAHRQAHGPFPSVQALVDVRGVGPHTVARLEPLVEVGAAPASP